MIYNDGTYEESELVWFVGYEDNNLYCMDRTGKINLVAIIPADTTNGDRYRANPICIKNGDIVVCFPDKSKKIYIYNINTMEMVDISLHVKAKRLTISNGWVFNDKLWCISYRTGQLFKCNLETKCVENVYQVCEASIVSGYGEGAFANDCLYFVSKYKSVVIEFDLKKERINEYDIKCDDGFGTILINGEYFYLTGYKKKIYEWNKKNDSLATYSFEEKSKFILEAEDKKTTRFFQSRMLNEYLVIVPQNNNTYVSNDIVVFNTELKELKTFTIKPKRAQREPGDYIVYNYSMGNKVVFQDYTNEDWIELDIITGDCTYIKMVVDDIKNAEFWRKNGVAGMHIESECMTLEHFISSI